MVKPSEYVAIVFLVALCVMFCVAITADGRSQAEEKKAHEDDTCFPKGVLVKSENMGLVCIDARAIRWDDTP